MAKWLSDSTLELILGLIDNGTRVVVCSGQPANFAGIAAVALADIAITAGAGGGDWSAIANGDVSGRKITLAAQADVDIDTSGTATHISIDDGSTLLAVTTCTSQALTDTGTVTIPAHDYEVQDPA
ncbi:MAG: hypothetical protein ABL993_02550 [Vicinamibacterales bacterium]